MFAGKHAVIEQLALPENPIPPFSTFILLDRIKEQRQGKAPTNPNLCHGHGSVRAKLSRTKANPRRIGRCSRARAQNPCNHIASS